MTLPYNFLFLNRRSAFGPHVFYEVSVDYLSGTGNGMIAQRRGGRVFGGMFLTGTMQTGDRGQ
jgi:hypothetical protein